jgi:hypothetical protein
MTQQPGPNTPTPYNAYSGHGAYGPPPTGMPWDQPMNRPPRHQSGLYLAAAIINWVVMGLAIVGTLGFGIFVAAWFIPMTIFIHKGAKDPYKHTGLAVCTLLFCNLISGILMLADNGNRHPRPHVY